MLTLNTKQADTHYYKTKVLLNMMTITIPTSWHEIEISKFPFIYDIVRDTEMEDYDKKIRLISILSDVSVNDLKKIKIEHIDKLLEEIQFVFKMEFPTEVNQFKHNGFNWVINYDPTNLSAGDFISLGKLTENEDSIINNLPQIVSLFVKPFKYKMFKKHEIEMDYKEKIENIKTMNVGIIYPVADFFCSVIVNLQQDIEDYLENQTEQAMKILRKELNSKSTMNTGVGI